MVFGSRLKWPGMSGDSDLIEESVEGYPKAGVW